MTPHDLLEDFLQEILDALINLDFELLHWAQNPRDTKQLQRIYSLFHKVKYDCNIIGAKKLQRIAEATEGLIVEVQLHIYDIQNFPVETFRKSADAFTAIVRNLLRDGVEGDREYTGLIQRLERETKAIQSI